MGPHIKSLRCDIYYTINLIRYKIFKIKYMIKENLDAIINLSLIDLKNGLQAKRLSSDKDFETWLK